MNYETLRYYKVEVSRAAQAMFTTYFMHNIRRASIQLNGNLSTICQSDGLWPGSLTGSELRGEVLNEYMNDIYLRWCGSNTACLESNPALRYLRIRIFPHTSKSGVTLIFSQTCKIVYFYLLDYEWYLLYNQHQKSFSWLTPCSQNIPSIAKL